MSFPTDIRAYFDQQIKQVDANLNLIDDALNDEPINIVETQKGYKLVLGAIEMAFLPNSQTEDITVTLVIYDKPARQEVNSYDILYCKGQDIKDLVVNIREQEAFANKNWTQITPVSMTPAQEETDDKLFSMTLEFNIRRDLRI